MEYKHNKDRKVFNIDFDGVLTIAGNYVDLTPSMHIIKKVRELYYAGHIIIIWSARQWSEANIVVGFLEVNSIPYHGLMLGKGGTDYYIDDKILSIDELLKHTT